MATARSIAVTTHGRYLVDASGRAAGAPVLVGFHGYVESAETQLERLRSIPGAHRWILVSIQALNRFYRGRSEEVVAGWMTRQDREQAIADNKAYVTAVLDEVRREHRAAAPAVFAGFSQGVAMAFRAADASPHPAAGVIALGSDVPPELDAASLSRIPRVLLGRGTRDEWYTAAKFDADVRRLTAAPVADLRPHQFEAGHEWTADFGAAAGRWLTETLTRR
jgi:predicted esterase